MRELPLNDYRLLLDTFFNVTVYENGGKLELSTQADKLREYEELAERDPLFAEFLKTGKVSHAG